MFGGFPICARPPLPFVSSRDSNGLFIAVDGCRLQKLEDWEGLAPQSPENPSSSLQIPSL